MSCQKSPTNLRTINPSTDLPSITLASATFLVVASLSLPSYAAPKTNNAQDEDSVTQLEGVTATAKKAPAGSNPNADPEAPYKVDKSGNNKFTEPLLNVSKTINVVGKEQIKDSGATALKDLMRTQPGITLGTGENGNADGDRFIIRGFDARGDMFVDGLRDPGMTTREIFATEQVEISKGPSSTFGGRGTTGGAVNSVSKKPQANNFAKGSVTVGDTKRASLDANRVVNDKLKVRANVMVEASDIAGRNNVFKKGHGVSLAADYQASDKVDVLVDYYHLRNEAMPDRGHPYQAVTGQVKIDRDNFYGYKNRDFWDTGADVLTGTVDVKLSNNTSISSKTRVGETTNNYIVSHVGSALDRRTGELLNRVNPSASSADFSNKFVGNNTQITHERHIGNVEHHVAAGVEVSHEKVTNTPYTFAPSTAANAIDLYHPNNNTPAPAITGRRDTSLTEAKVASVYVMDTAKLNQNWQVFGGLRHDTFDIEKRARASNYEPDSDPKAKTNFLNGHAGVVYKPRENASIYGSISTSSNIPGEAYDSGGADYGGINASTQAAKPEKNKSFELGTKWNLANDNLALNAAIFQTDKKNKVEAVGAGSSALLYQTGAVRVKGAEVGVSGNVTPKLSLAGGAVYMDTNITDSATASNIGKKLANVAEKSASIQAKYQTTPKLALGGTVVHTGKIQGGSFAGDATRELPSSNRLDLMAEYKLNKKLSTQLNVKNATDKTIYEAVYRGGFSYVAPGRTTSLSLNYDF